MGVRRTYSKKDNMIYKGEIVYLRALEPEDYEKTYLFRDYEMQKMTCGPIRFSSKAMEKNWAQAKALDNSRDIYLAICLIENDEMIGWYSINDIDYRNRKCHCGGIVIGNRKYRDGLAYEEAGNLAFRYIINELNMNRITGSCLRQHIMSRAMMEASYWSLEGIERQSIFKEGRYHDVCHYAILKDEYLEHLNNGDFEPRKRMLRLGKAIKQLKADNKQ